MDFREATGQMMELGVSLREMAEHIGVSRSLLIQARMDPFSSGFRNPPGGWMEGLEELAIYSLPDDYYDFYFQAIRDVDSADIGLLARRYLSPDQMAIVAVGPADALEKQLGGLGPIEVRGLTDPAAEASQ